MAKYEGYYSATDNETYDLVLIPRVKNSAYEYDYDNTIKFYGRPANNQEKRTFRLQAGVNAQTDSVYIYSSNLPDTIKPGDKIIFLGNEQTVEGVGYYFDNNGILNANVFDPEYIIAKCGKGITLGR